MTLIREGDGLHFNAIGYTIVTREIAELAVEEFGCRLGRSRRTSSSSGDRHVGDPLHRRRHVLLAVLDLREPSVQVVVVGLHVERAVPDRLKRITRSSPASRAAIASSIAPRTAWADSGAGTIPSVCANRTAASNTAFCE